MTDDLVRDVVDLALPALPPYEFTVYVYLMRHADSESRVTVGVRTIARELGRGTRSDVANYQQIQAKIEALAEEGFVVVESSGRSGTTYRVRKPREVPVIAERLEEAVGEQAEAEDYFTDPELRGRIFERDGYRCAYCGDELTEETATLDHVVPQVAGGEHTSENLVACCHECNSIKGDRTYEEAAADLLDRVRRRNTD